MFYEIRVKKVADKVIDLLLGQETITKNDITTMVDHYAQGNVHYKSSKESKREFLKDITIEVKQKIIVTPKKRPFRAKNNPKFLQAVAYLIEESAGNAFPDGDPIDAIAEGMDRLAGKYDYDVFKVGYYVSDVDNTPLVDILDAAAKKYLGVKDYNTYNENMWDDVHADTVHDHKMFNLAKDKTKWGQPSQMFGSDPTQVRNPWRESFNEAMERYDNNIQLAIVDIGQIPEDEARDLAKKMSLDDYLNFIIAVDKDDDPVARNILNHYLGGLPLVYEAVAQEMHNMIRNKDAYVISPDFKKLHEMDQRKVLAEMTSEGMKKILANLRGYEYPGTYESSIFTVQINEDIIRLIKNIKIDMILGKRNLLELSGNAPGAAAQAAAYGGGVSSNSTTGGTSKKMARFQNDKGEEEEGEVVSQDSRETTVRTKTGIKKIANDQVFVSEAVLADIVRLAGIKK